MSTTPNVTEETKKLVMDHVVELGFKREYISSPDYSNCTFPEKTPAAIVPERPDQLVKADSKDFKPDNIAKVKPAGGKYIGAFKPKGPSAGGFYGSKSKDTESEKSAEVAEKEGGIGNPKVTPTTKNPITMPLKPKDEEESAASTESESDTDSDTKVKAEDDVNSDPLTVLAVLSLPGVDTVKDFIKSKFNKRK